jgi:microcystin-dependent protein
MPGQTTTLHLPYPVPGDTVDVPRDVAALANAIDPLGVVPIGAMLMWPTAVAPGGWLLMQGQKVAAATYPALAAMFGQDGSGNVTIPDMRDTFPVGAGATALGTTGGAASVALSTAQLPSHAHGGLTGFRDRNQSHSHAISGQWAILDVAQQATGTGPKAFAQSAITVDPTDPADHKHTITAEGGGGAHENRPPFRAVNFIIRAG